MEIVLKKQTYNNKEYRQTNKEDFNLEVLIMKRTYQPNKRKAAKKHGFFARKETDILKNRRRKGRKVLCK